MIDEFVGCGMERISWIAGISVCVAMSLCGGVGVDEDDDSVGS